MPFSDTWFSVFDKNVPNFILRLILMLLGVACIAFGIALSRATDLGISAISCIPGVLNYATGFSLGTLTFAFNVLLVCAQIALLRRKFNPFQLLCIPFLAVFSWLIDVFVPVAALFPMPVYPARLLFSIISCCFIALGVWLQKKALLIMLPGDGIVQTISAVFHTDFGKTKVGFDVTMIVTAAIISLVSMGGLYGVREGSVIAACIVGIIIRFIDGRFPNFERFAPTKGHVTLIVN